jgi:SWI/SNF-related matrix-associated actin-dependent regulator of chromatin subfamily A3
MPSLCSFLQWTSFLDLIESKLHQSRISFARIDGSMSRQERDQAMVRFNTKGTKSIQEPRILLCSLKAACVGINLVRGNHVYLMDPFWNEATELQAMDRVHRHGQTRPVRVVRFVMNDSLEERMLNIQSAKSALGKASMEKLSKSEYNQARITCLRDLFQVKKGEEVMDWDASFIASDDEFDG